MTSLKLQSWLMLRNMWWVGGWDVMTSLKLHTWLTLRNMWYWGWVGGVGCNDRKWALLDSWSPCSVNTMHRGKVNASLGDYLYIWMCWYAHVPHDLRVTECTGKLRHLACNK